ncbi:MAG: hypothetical protein G01um101417_390 [Parcubacteria group bacterium Gr01-1014_17]|nr:MAG: hypothetical protein G01um101417_390 [Parcubacteria group bacterium Gr01-1014_17]
MKKINENRGFAPAALLVLAIVVLALGSAIVGSPPNTQGEGSASESAAVARASSTKKAFTRKEAKKKTPARKMQSKTQSSSAWPAVVQEIEDAQKREIRFGEEHSNRILRDLAAFETGNYAKADIERLRKIVQSLSPHITDAANSKIPSESSGIGKYEFLAVKGEIEEAQKSRSMFPEQHSDRVLRDLVSFETGGYAKSEIERLRKIVRALSPHIEDAARAAKAAENDAAKVAAKKACAEAAPPVLTADITDFSKIQSITAPGSPSHEGPKGHSFINTVHARMPLYAPIASIYDSGSYTKDSPESPAQYLLFFRVKEGCGYQFKFDHADELIPSLTDELFTATPKIADSRTAPATKTIEFAAGELIGYTSGTPQAGNWDFGLYNMNEEGKLAAQGSYAMHRYSVCWPDFYSPEKKEKYRKLLEGPRLVCSF